MLWPFFFVSYHILFTCRNWEEVPTFIGCTGSGIPKIAPVAILNRPEKTRVAGRSIEPWMVSAIVSGRRVPKSPRAPEISDVGEVRRIWRL